MFQLQWSFCIFLFYYTLRAWKTSCFPVGELILLFSAWFGRISDSYGHFSPENSRPTKGRWVLMNIRNWPGFGRRRPLPGVRGVGWVSLWLWSSPCPRTGLYHPKSQDTLPLLSKSVGSTFVHVEWSPCPFTWHILNLSFWLGSVAW